MSVPLSKFDTLRDARRLQHLQRVDPSLYARLDRRVKAETREAEKIACEDDFIEFFRRAWREMGEAGELILNWHHEEIADVLVSQAYGIVKNAVFNQPPRTSKTSLASIALPAWIWIQPQERWGPLMGPHVAFFCLSYGATLAEEIALKHRRLVAGDWYQSRWGDRVKLREDQSSRANFATTAGGGRISSSIEGGILGRGGIWIIVDDPHRLNGVESEVQRRETIDGMRALTTRINDPVRGARTLIMQRLHEDDATNYALENWGAPVKHLMFPMRYDSARAIPEDHRSDDGALLWPAVWNERSVKQEEKELGEYNSSGQLQQMPVPKGGGLIKREWWRLWPQDAQDAAEFQVTYKCYHCGWQTQASPAAHGDALECESCGHIAEVRVVFPDTSFRLLSVDTAFSDQDIAQNSWSAATAWGIWHDKDESPRTMLMNSWRGRVPLHGAKTGQKGLVEVIHELATRSQVDMVLIERKTRGIDLFNEIERLMGSREYRLEYFEPTGRGDKTARLMATQNMFTNDLVWAPNKAWAEMVINEVASQPRAQFWDLTDTCTGALIYLRENGLLKLGYEHSADKRREQTFRSARSSNSVANHYEGT